MFTREFPTQVEGTEFPFLHFYWVGAPPETYGGSVGHDVDRVLQWETHIKKNPILFWCLDEYVEHYQAKFKGKSIRVCSIDKFLAQPFLDPQDANVAKHIALKKKDLLNHPHRNRITDRASIKEFIELFTLDYYGGYGLDTNTKPHPKLGESLDPYKDLCMVYNSIPPEQKYTIDYWLIYAPERAALAGKRRLSSELLNWYITQFDEKEKIYKQHGYAEIYRQGCRSIIPQFARANLEGEGVTLFPYKIEKTYIATIPDFMIKHYHNSHSTVALLYDSNASLFRHAFSQFLNETPYGNCGMEAKNALLDFLTHGDLEDEKSANPLILFLESCIDKVGKSREIFYAVKKRDTNRLSELLKAGANILETIETADLEKATILHVAAEFPDLEQLRLLLKYHANPKLKAKLRNSPLNLTLTPEIYARRLKNQLIHAGEKCDPVLLEWINVLVAHTQELDIEAPAKQQKVKR